MWEESIVFVSYAYIIYVVKTFALYSLIGGAIIWSSYKFWIFGISVLFIHYCLFIIYFSWDSFFLEVSAVSSLRIFPVTSRGCHVDALSKKVDLNSCLMQTVPSRHESYSKLLPFSLIVGAIIRSSSSFTQLTPQVCFSTYLQYSL